MTEKKNAWLGSLALTLTAVIWGSAFVAQRTGMEHIGPYTFNGVRCCIGAVALLPVSLLLSRRGEWDRRSTLLGGLLCGLCMFFASNLQQLALVDTDAGKAGFITTFYIVLVPVLGLLRGKRCGRITWVAVAMALAGLYFLCMSAGSFSLRKGDLLLLLSALCYSVHILLVDHFVQRADGVCMSGIQFAVCGLLTLIPAFTLEEPSMQSLRLGIVPLLYAGLLSCGVAYTMQIVGQRHLRPAVASLIMSMESVFAVLSGWLILHERLSPRELLGCALVFAAVLLVQLWPQKDARKAAQV